jgi:DNA-binding transcriptional ArsR family regulator
MGKMTRLIWQCYVFKMMTKTRRLRTCRELRTLASPERLEIIQALHGRPPMSVRQLGETLGRLPVSLYYHVRALEKIGLVGRAGTQPAGKRHEALYELRVHGLQLRPDKWGPAEVAALRRIGAGVFRRAHRLHDAGVAEAPRKNRLERRHTLAQRTVFLDAEGLRKLNKRLFELTDHLHESPSGSRGGAFYTITLHLARDESRG